ncbi:hypothetical protein [Sphingomonas sp.]|uniref:hypothetical protein n=1 Tax=Sphingomonas sp. TaxID=28214 RepID=UPI003BA9D59C
MTLFGTKPVQLPTGSWPARIGAVVIALLFIGLLFQSRVGFMLARIQPDAALAIAPTNPEALRGNIDYRLMRAKREDQAALTDLSLRALRAEAYNPTALRTLGLFAAFDKKDAQAERLFSMSARFSLRDLFTHAWLLENRLANGRYAEAFSEADILLRQRSTNWEVIVPMLAQRLKDKRLIAPMADILATNPSWRGMLLHNLADEKVDLEAGHALLARLAALGSPPTIEEASPYFQRAVTETRLPLLHRRWMALLPRATRIKAAGLLRDGDFAAPDIPPPFGWRFRPEDGVIVERGESLIPGQGSALYVSYPGDRQVTFAEQQLVLGAGRYRLAGRTTTDADLPAGQVYWSLRCGSGAKESEIAKQPLSPGIDLPDRFTLTFDVPPGCIGPRLSLIGGKSETIESANLWVDALTLTRVP